MRRLSFLVLSFGLLALSHHSFAAVINVTTTQDLIDAGDKQCSLREAIINTNENADIHPDCTALGGYDSLTHDNITLPEGTYCLSASGTDEDDATTGDLDIKESLILSGAGSNKTIIDGGHDESSSCENSPLGDRIIHILPTVLESVEIEGVKITGGSLSFDASNSSENSNALQALGGGIYAEAPLNIINTIISQNSVNSGPYFGYAAGGGIYAKDSLGILNSHLLENKAESPNGSAAGGGVSFAVTETVSTNLLTVVESTFSKNQTIAKGDIYGGTIYSNSNVTLVSTQVLQNSAVAQDNGSGGGNVYGGAIYAPAGLMLSESVVEENTVQADQAILGGAILARSSVRVEYSSLLNNKAVSKDRVVYGGAMAIYSLPDSTVRFFYSTLSGNEIVAKHSSNGGALHIDPYDTLEVTLEYVTLFGNRVVSENQAAGGAIGVGSGIEDSFVYPVVFNLKNNIIAGNTVEGQTGSFGANCYKNATWNSYGYNLITTVSTADNCDLISLANAGTDILNITTAEAKINATATVDEGGLMKVNTLLEGSPALDASDCKFIDGRSVFYHDQTREICHIGSYQNDPSYAETDQDNDNYDFYDCDDTNANINPAVEEICNDGIDNDCNGLIDEDDVVSCDATSNTTDDENLPAGSNATGSSGCSLNTHSKDGFNLAFFLLSLITFTTLVMITRRQKNRA